MRTTITKTLGFGGEGIYQKFHKVFKLLNLGAIENKDVVMGQF